LIEALRYAGVAAIIALLACLAGLFLSPWVDGIAFDAVYWLQAERADQADKPAGAETTPVSVIVIDEETYSRPPFAGTPRVLWTPHLGAVLNALTEAGASVVGFDMVFATSATGLVLNYDRDFLLAMRKSGMEGHVVIGELLADPLPIGPAPAFAFAIGHPTSIRPVNIRREADGVVRVMPLFFDAKDGPKTSFALEIAMRHRGRPVAQAEDGSASFEGTPIPGTANGNLFIDPGANAHPAPTYSFADLYDCAAAGKTGFFAEHFAGRIVLVGSDLLAEDRIIAGNRLLLREAGPATVTARCSSYEGEVLSLPVVDNTIAGVYLHAAAIRQILGPGGPDRLTGAPAWALLIATAFLFAALSIRLGGAMLIAILVMAVAGPVALAVVAYKSALVLPLGGMMIAALGGIGGMAGYRRLVVDSSERYLRRAFSLYLPKAQVDRLVEAGGEGFTTIAESLEPGEAAALLNRCFDRLGEIIEDNQGHIDKFIGDGLIAIFGAPVADPDHAGKAADSAAAMLRSLEEDPIEAPGGRLRIRVGVNTGSVLIGNIGSSRRFNYTVIGDAVNLAARLESLNKAYGTHLLISEDTVTACKEGNFREIDLVAVTGRSAPTAVFQPVADRDAAERYAEALALYRQGGFSEARAIFTELADNDPAAAALARRCETYEKHPPPDWDGIFRPESK
jgi:adenylate cyclase